MSTLSVSNLQGLATGANTITVPAGHIFDVNGDLIVPSWTTANRPAVPAVGAMGYNTESGTVQIYTGGEAGWVDVGKAAQDGTSAEAAVERSTDIVAANATAQTGWYWIKVAGTAYQFWVDTVYDGGGWVLVMNNRRGNNGMNNLTYANATSNVINARGSYGAGTSPSGFNLFVGLDAWKTMCDANTGVNRIVQFVATSYQRLQDQTSHTKRGRFEWTSWSNSYAMTGYSNYSLELGTENAGWWSGHIVNDYSLTTYDQDQDSYGTNCANLYGGNPWWYGACWSGNFWAGNSHQDAPYWYSSGADNHNYGAVYIK